MMKKRSSGVDIGSSLDNVSKQFQAVSTLDTVPRRPVWQF
ncbi:hypothetical protein Taro_021644 [Colocasia esculenta]|uniref:Uncharacterized protein n=1 Tax=Colocasia esculenta TaxID=4460 RepID=A0A843UZI6_COLES|nr:hypothetical protein [Colocasia esculenta]